MGARSPGRDKLNSKGVQQRGPLATSPSKDKWVGAHAAPPLRIRKVKRGNLKPMRFASLHHHSTFSYLDGYQLPEAHVRRAEELNMGAFALTEHGNIDSHVKFERAASDSGVKPIYGCELYMPCPWDDRGQRKMHLTVLAQNAVGYQNLLRLVTDSWHEGFYYEPTVDMGSLVAYGQGLVILSGCAGSLLTCSVAGGKGLDPMSASLGRGLRVAREFKRHFGGNYYIEVQGFPELEGTRRANPRLAQIAKRLGIRLVASMDCHYTALEESEVQKILHNLRPGERRTLEDMAKEWSYDVGLCPPASDGTILRKLQATGLSKAQAVEAVQSTADIAEGCTVDLPRLEMVRFPVDDKFKSAEVYMGHLINEGWRRRGLDKLPVSDRARYKAQLRREFDLIKSKDYCDYFLIVADSINWVKDQGIPVGPARGSVAASLVAYCMRITEINPMQYPLLVFERFIDESREDLPDIDIDFPSEVRDTGMLRDYLATKYPSVANVGTFNYFKGRNSLDDIARVFKVPKTSVETIKDLLIERSSGDLRASATVEDTYESFPKAAAVVDQYPELRKATLLEGNVKNPGVHAAGYVVANDDISKVSAIYKRKVHDVVLDVVTFDKEDAERQGLIKMDFLGLSTMSALWQILRWLHWDLDQLYGLPLDDAASYQAFRLADVVGVFQLDGRACRGVVKQLKPDMFSEVMDCNTLARPGPLHNGSPRIYSDVKFGRAKADETLRHPAIAAITEPTKFQIIYQEQVLRIVREVGDFPWTSAAYIRKIISRKLGEQEFNRQWDRFWSGCQTLPDRTAFPPISYEQAKSTWGEMVTSGSYSFNAAHSAAYGVLACWTMYFKQNHPEMFYAALMKFYNDEKQLELIRDAARPPEGTFRPPTKVLPPHAKYSGVSWKPVRSAVPTVRAGLSQVPKIGSKTAAKMIQERKRSATGQWGWKDFSITKGVGPKTIEKLIEFEQSDDPFGAYRVERSINRVIDELQTDRLSDPRTKKLLPYPTHEAHELQDMPITRQRQEVVWLGTIVKRNVRDMFEVNLARRGEALDPVNVRDPELSEFAILTGIDREDMLLLKIDRWKWPIFKNAISEMKLDSDLLLVKGKRPQYRSAYGLVVEDCWTIDPEG